ncbi:MAG: hypothetical protein MUC47_00955, partial [Candidatus Kapabacteria bacterium]|nr:hypothetical protein [Candidatus Kapabacteria bacterium]
MVGDGARLGGSNVEYLLREDQLGSLLRAIQSQTISALMQIMEEINTGIKALASGAFKIYGSDIV